MKNIRFFLYENFQFLVVKFSVYLNRHVFIKTHSCFDQLLSTSFRKSGPYTEEVKLQTFVMI